MASAAGGSVPMSIVAQKKGNTAEVRIIGYIGWETNCEDFRRQVDALLADGVKDVNLYVNSPGGSCFDANEIVNILRRFPGTISGEGGALVASAATYIGMHCSTFVMPENGTYMVHKPSSMVEGTAAQIEQKTKLLRDLEKEYFDTYRARATDPADFEAKWNAGDYWMTAAEAKDAGFITGVTKKITIDKASAVMLSACGCPAAPTLVKNIHNEPDKIKNNMEFIALLLGLKKDATEAEITAAIQALQAKAGTADTLNAEMRSMRTAQITAVVDAGLAARKFTADRKDHFLSLGESAGIDALRTTIDLMPPASKPSEFIDPSSPGDAGKTWDKLTAEERIALRESNRAEYDKLLAAHRNS